MTDSLARLGIIIFVIVFIGGAIKGQIDKQKPDTPPPQIERNCQ